MPFSVTVSRTFSAAHAIRFPDGTAEPLHGHNWEVQVTVTRDPSPTDTKHGTTGDGGGGTGQGGWGGGLDPIGFVVDFHDLESQLDAILRPLSSANLNDVPQLADLNPTAELVAWHIARSLRLTPPVRLESVQITEAPGCIATYRP